MRVPLTFPMQMAMTSPLWQNHVANDPEPSPFKTYMATMLTVCQKTPAAASPLPCLFYEGSSRLIDYRDPQKKYPGRAGVFFIPSLVNRSHILDLLPNCSMIRAFAAQHPTFLLDWGIPERYDLDLSDYIHNKLIPALQVAVLQTKGPVHLVGYCMGGILAAIVAFLAPHLVKSLVFLATPWDFNPMIPPEQRPMIPAIMAGFQAVKQQGRCLHPSLLQTLFLLNDPVSHIHRYTKKTEDADKFLHLEDWIQHGLPLAPDIGLSALSDYYLDNKLHKNILAIGDQFIDFTKIKHPAFIVSPTQDSIVPQKSAKALMQILKQAEIITPETGHIGMIIGTSAHKKVWHPVMQWMQTTEEQKGL